MDRLDNRAVGVVCLVALVMLLAVAGSTSAAEPEPIQFSGVAAPGGGLVTIFTVPPKKRLVIEHVSADAPITGGSRPHLLLRTLLTTPPGPLSHFLVLTRQADNGPATHWLASQPMRVYANPDTDVEIQYFCEGCENGFLVTVTVSGVLVKF